MDFDLYIRKTETRSTTALFWFEYIAVFRDEYYARLWRYEKPAKLVDMVAVSFNEEEQHSLKDGYRKASKTETAKFLLLVKNKHNKKS